MYRRGLPFRPATTWLAIMAAAGGLRPAMAAQAVGLAPEAPAVTIAGPSLRRAESAEAAALAFAQAHAAERGLNLGHLRPVSPPRRFAQGLETDGGQFQLLTFQQVLTDGVKMAGLGKVGEAPVIDAELRVLVRDEPGYPVVLARSTLQPVKRVLSARDGWPEIEVDDVLIAAMGGQVEVEERAPCAWVTGGVALPAVRCIVRRGEPGDEGYARALVVVDASREAIGRTAAERLLLHRDLVSRAGATVQVSGLVASDCLPAGIAPMVVERPLAHARVTSSSTGAVYTDALGRVELPGPIAPGTIVSSLLRGRWFRVVSTESPDLATSGSVEPGGTLSLVHNVGGRSLADTAQVNAYVAANEVRDWALRYQPEFPGLDHYEMPIRVGLGSTCNAFYDGASLNFFRAGGGCANTAYCSIVHHEYGHHLVSMAGSGQGAYGEGFADVVAMLMRDDPGFAYGYHGDPAVPLRTAENLLTHPCVGEAHICGMVLSGAVWEVRNRLAVTEPEAYRDILTRLILSSVFLHTGAAISPEIVVDVLTLDDDDHDIFNGTPHYAQIAEGFAAHGLAAPPLPPVGLHFSSGVPHALSPDGASIVAEEVRLGGSISSLTLHIEVDGAAVSVPAEEFAPGRFAVVFPPLPCGAQVFFRFEIVTDDGQVVANPMRLNGTGSPAAYEAVVATAAPAITRDDFEQDIGWTVTNSGGLTDGAWERGVPAALGDRGDPLADFDGSGACWLTANRCCNSDVDNGFTTLTSPALDVSEALAGGSLGRVELSYARWFSNATSGAPRDDEFLVEISGDNGQSWMVLERIGPEGPDVSGGWVHRHFVISDLTRPGGGALIQQPGLVRLRFTASDTGVGSIVEAAVDALEIKAYACGDVCPCERDGDVEQIDVFDLLHYLDAWFAATPDADVNGDDVIDVYDLLAYLDCWFGACG